MTCVADSFDAMNTNRVYRNKLSKERIIEEIETNKGRQFDPEIAEVFLRLLRENRLPTESWGCLKIGGSPEKKRTANNGSRLCTRVGCRHII